MTSGEGAATLGVGLGVVLIIIGKTSAGLGIMLLGIAVFAVLSIGTGRDDRGQVMGPTPILPVVFVITALVGFFVVQEIEAELEASTTTHLCNGFWGCGPAPARWYWLAAVAFALPLGLAAVRYVRHRPEETDTK